jgi:hypothetical protein
VSIADAAIVAGAATFVVVLLMIWKKLTVVEARLSAQETRIQGLQSIETRHFLMALNAKSKAEDGGPDSPTSNGGEVGNPARLPPRS